MRPLVEAALNNELGILQAGIQRTEQRLRAFETQYGRTSEDFIQCYENDDLPETMEFVEWVGEYRLRERLGEKAEIFQEIRFAN